MSNILNFGIPKGSLEDATVGLFKKAGWQISISSRSYFPGVDDTEMNCKLIRPQEMARYVERETIDAGIAGRDWVRENDSDVVEVCEMVYSKVSRRPARWVLVVNGDSQGAETGRSSRRHHFHRTGRFYQALFCRAEYPGQRRVFLGRHRSQGS